VFERTRTGLRCGYFGLVQQQINSCKNNQSDLLIFKTSHFTKHVETTIFLGTGTSSKQIVLIWRSFSKKVPVVFFLEDILWYHFEQHGSLQKSVCTIKTSRMTIQEAANKDFQKIDLCFLENKQGELILKRVILFKFLFVLGAVFLPVLELSLLCFYFLFFRRTTLFPGSELVSPSRVKYITRSEVKGLFFVQFPF
jgi:hypothetical protein